MGDVNMSAKEKLLNIFDFIGEEEATQILVYAKEAFKLKSKTWDDIEEDDPFPDEVLAFKEHRKC
jgi:hypothetical protein